MCIQIELYCRGLVRIDSSIAACRVGAQANPDVDHPHHSNTATPRAASSRASKPAVCVVKHCNASNGGCRQRARPGAGCFTTIQIWPWIETRASAGVWVVKCIGLVSLDTGEGRELSWPQLAAVDLGVYTRRPGGSVRGRDECVRACMCLC